MLTAVVTLVGESVSVHFVNSASTDTTTPEEQTVTTQGEGVVTSEKAPHEGAIDTADGLVADGGTAHVSLEEAAPGPNPIVPEVKEVLWGAGAFIVFALIMRYVAFPKLKRGMDARYDGIRNDHEQADAMRLGAQAEVADYQARVASAKAEAAARIDAARQELETQRTARIAAVNAEIAEQRAAAAAENEAARLAVQDQIQAAVADVSSSAIRLAVGKAPNPDVVNRVVSNVMNAGANS
ncbi:MAG: ATP synthase F0 subunit B [Ilumatobacteraceae bacterium]